MTLLACCLILTAKLQSNISRFSHNPFSVVYEYNLLSHICVLWFGQRFPFLAKYFSLLLYTVDNVPIIISFIFSSQIHYDGVFGVICVVWFTTTDLWSSLVDFFCCLKTEPLRTGLCTYFFSKSFAGSRRGKIGIGVLVTWTSICHFTLFFKFDWGSAHPPCCSRVSHELTYICSPCARDSTRTITQSLCTTVTPQQIPQHWNHIINNIS